MNKIIIISFLFSIVLACSGTKKITQPKKEVTAKKTSLSEKNKRKFDEYFFEGLKQKALENNDEAIEAFKKAIEINPNSAASYHEISVIQSREGSFVNALQAAEKAVFLNNDNKWYIVQLANMQKKSFQYENMLKSYEKLVKIDPENLDFLIGLSESYMHNQKPEKAADVFTKIENIMGTNDELTMQKQSLYLQAGKNEKAVAEIKKLVEKNPNDPKYLNMLAQLYEQTGKKEKALEQYKKIVKINPNDGMASLSLARYYKNKNENDKVQSYMKTVFSDTKISPSLKLSILMDYIQESLTNSVIKKQTAELIAVMQKTHPKNVKSYVGSGDFYAQHNELEKARKEYLTASTLDENSYPIWVQLLSLDMELKNNTYLKNDSKKAIDLFPTQPAFYLYNGIAQNQLKEYKSSIETLELGKDLVIDNNALLVDFYRYLGENYHELKQHKKADNNFEKALEINPNQPFLLNNYSYYLSVRKEKLTQAAEMAKKANELLKNQSSFEDTYGWVLFQQKKYKEAETWIKNALDNGGNESGVILEHYGDVLFMLGKTTEALTYWKKAKTKTGYTNKLDKKISNKKYVE